MVTVGCEEY